MASQAHPRTTVFISYSHADKKWLDRLLKHLGPLERDYPARIWSDLYIEAGEPWREKIGEALDSAAIFVLLLSADFVASQFITDEEVPKLLLGAQKRGAAVLPVVVKSCRLPVGSDLAEVQSVNDPKTPLDKMTEAEQEETYTRVAERVGSLLGAAGGRPAEPAPADEPRPAYGGDCEWYVERLHVHIAKETSLIWLIRAAVVVTAVVWLTMVMAVFLFEQDLSVPPPVVLLLVVPCLGAIGYSLKKQIDIKLIVNECEIMKGKFVERCPKWSLGEYERNIRQAENILLLAAQGRNQSLRKSI